MENYTLKEWLESHDDVSLYDNVYLLDIRRKEINIYDYNEKELEEIMNCEVISEEVCKEDYFENYELTLDILKLN